MQYVPHLVYSTAITSLGIHLLWQRKTAEAQRGQLAAQTSILAALAERLRAGEDVPPREFDRLWRLAQSHDFELAEAREREKEREKEQGTIGWREVLLGRKQDAEEKRAREKRAEEWDRKDLERVREEGLAPSRDQGRVTLVLSYTLRCSYGTHI
ncbi:hypothetical protein A0H81_10104 [Grifola frondosa]|uniref:Uncharacterized protein n=1 Tax=Grifola frondosa TaxID=5627 RepID=A0A1C7LZ49_GRIFR|nr:hypothetical protein A0H81_10104 [Grifola frondosa]